MPVGRLLKALYTLVLPHPTHRRLGCRVVFSDRFSRSAIAWFIFSRLAGHPIQCSNKERTVFGHTARIYHPND